MSNAIVVETVDGVVIEKMTIRDSRTVRDGYGLKWREHRSHVCYFAKYLGRIRPCDSLDEARTAAKALVAQYGSGK
jgi:hypothetical protein